MAVGLVQANFKPNCEDYPRQSGRLVIDGILGTGLDCGYFVMSAIRCGVAGKRRNYSQKLVTVVLKKLMTLELASGRLWDPWKPIPGIQDLDLDELYDQEVRVLRSRDAALCARAAKSVRPTRRWRSRAQ